MTKVYVSLQPLKAVPFVNERLFHGLSSVLQVYLFDWSKVQLVLQEIQYHPFLERSHKLFFVFRQLKVPYVSSRVWLKSCPAVGSILAYITYSVSHYIANFNSVS